MVVLDAKEESPTRAVLEIEVPVEEVEETRIGMTRAYAKQAAIPGFRKGHAPESVVQKRFAEQIREDCQSRSSPQHGPTTQSVPSATRHRGNPSYEQSW